MKRPYERVKMNVVNQSERNGPVLLIVIHSTEGQNLPGVTDLENLGSWFDNPVAQASCHVGVDAQGYSGQYVLDGRKAWQCASFNSNAIGIELVGKMSQSWWPDKQYRKAARYVAYWSKKYGMPIRRAQINKWSGAIIKSGVIRHSDLGVRGGNHGDPGKGFKMGRLLWLARWYRVRG